MSKDFPPKACPLTLSTSNILHPGPPVEDHGAVVIDVQEGQLVVLLPQDEEDLNLFRRQGGMCVNEGLKSTEVLSVCLSVWLGHCLPCH